MQPVKFSTENNEFWRVLRARVDDYFRQRNLSRYAGVKTYFKMGIMLTAFTGAYAVIIFCAPSAPVILLLSVVMGFAMSGIGFSVSHAAAHNAVSPHKKTNRLLSLSFNLLGMSDYLWKIKHNVLHHTYTNIYEVDEAMREGESMRMTFNAPWRPWHRFQYLYAVVIYGFYTVLWIFYLDFEKLLRHNAHGSFEKKKHPWQEVVLFWITKIYYITFAFIIPHYYAGIGWGPVIAGFLVMHVIASLFITHVLQVEHIAEETIHMALQDDGTVHKTWAANQLEGTCNFKAGPLLEWYVSGTNYQIEHHLFPLVSPEHFPGISKIVQQTAAEFGLQYQVQPSFGRAIASHYRMLKKLGRAEQLETTPVV